MLGHLLSTFVDFVSVMDGVSGAKTLLEKGADANLVGTRDAAAIHLAAGAECHREYYTTLMLSHSANPNVPYVFCMFMFVCIY